MRPKLQNSLPRGGRAKVPVELLHIAGAVLAVLGTVGAGAALISTMTERATPWCVAGAYAAPAAVAVAFYWLIGEQLRRRRYRRGA